MTHNKKPLLAKAAEVLMYSVLGRDVNLRNKYRRGSLPNERRQVTRVKIGRESHPSLVMFHVACPLGIQIG
jgi:hypothetical protein